MNPNSYLSWDEFIDTNRKSLEKTFRQEEVMNYYLVEFGTILFIIRAESEITAETKAQEYVTDKMFGGVPRRPPRVKVQKLSDFTIISADYKFIVNSEVDE